MIPKQLVILGGGASIRPYWDGEHKDKGLFELLPKIFTCGLNYSYKYVQTTFNLGVDATFYNANKKNLDALPLYIGRIEQGIINPGPNTWWFPGSNTYNRDLIGGIYSPTLAGIFALSLFIKVMEEGEIFLLGFDYGPTRNEKGQVLSDANGIPVTHWYQGKTGHKGIGKISWYTSTFIDTGKTGKRITQAEGQFRNYADEKRVKIYNVGLSSGINNFEKLSYEQFFSKVLITEHNQEAIRDSLRERLKVLSTGVSVHGKFTVPLNCNIQNKKGPFEIKQ